jgi:hypothetical protein
MEPMFKEIKSMLNNLSPVEDDEPGWELELDASERLEDMLLQMIAGFPDSARRERSKIGMFEQT